MILDIDNSKSAQTFVRKITSGWFDVDSMYYDLKSDSQTKWSNFWSISDSMISTISNYLKCSSEQFLKLWEEKCIIYGAIVRAYHCTRHSDKEVFIKNGILPLSKKTIEISQNQQRPDAEEKWNSRSELRPGPNFYLSYKSAKNPNNHYFNGPEILLAANGHQPTSNPEKSIPLIIHCEIPFSILPNKKYNIFCTLKVYLNFLDPEDSTEDLFEGTAIDLNGNPLKPKYIVRIEEI